MDKSAPIDHDDIAIRAVKATDAIHINYHSIVTGPHGVRIAFGEGAQGEPSWKTAVFMSPADALLLIESITRLLENEPDLKATAEARVAEIKEEAAKET